MTDQQRVELSDPAGRPVLSYLPGTIEGVPAARDVVVLGEGAAEVVLRELPGHVVMAPVELGTRLVELGAGLRRHGHGLRRDLRADPPPADWATVRPPDPLRVVPFAHTAEQLAPAWHAAYPPGHVDHHADGSLEPMRRLLAGQVLGPVLPCSAVMVEGESVVACVIVTEGTSDPWITDVFRDPAPTYAGLGGLLLRRVVAEAHATGLAAIGLAVTEGNPARALYERLGFVLFESTVSVRVP
ncbi:GNAT superfamily N-acetyltransferase [Kutzneria viridogrisea]|uniref:GNAT superfamily N-acetyltransferase n=1 Tax=Kutzneria viridogrisea TaxID=47990 RepID=A0ABR6BCS0_9PSEU|nr:GNAT superfamily N-acetyltransferase [Kutzneria viridogrisea]